MCGMGLPRARAWSRSQDAERLSGGIESHPTERRELPSKNPAVSSAPRPPPGAPPLGVPHHHLTHQRLLFPQRVWECLSRHQIPHPTRAPLTPGQDLECPLGPRRPVAPPPLTEKAVLREATRLLSVRTTEGRSLESHCLVVRISVLVPSSCVT